MRPLGSRRRDSTSGSSRPSRAFRDESPSAGFVERFALTPSRSRGHYGASSERGRWSVPEKDIVRYDCDATTTRESSKDSVPSPKLNSRPELYPTRSSAAFRGAGSGPSGGSGWWTAPKDGSSPGLAGTGPVRCSWAFAGAFFASTCGRMDRASMRMRKMPRTSSSRMPSARCVRPPRPSLAP